MSENTVIDQTEVPDTLVEYDQWICWRAVATTTEFYDPDAGEPSVQSSTASAGASVSVENDDSRTNAYVVEKNRLLNDRVVDLEATLKQRNERIATLEAEVERLEANGKAHGRESGPAHETHAACGETDERGETESIWDQARRLFVRGSE